MRIYQVTQMPSREDAKAYCAGMICGWVAVASGASAGSSLGHMHRVQEQS